MFLLAKEQTADQTYNALQSGVGLFQSPTAKTAHTELLKKYDTFHHQHSERVCHPPRLRNCCLYILGKVQSLS